jgi:hypothetical protein
LGGVFICLPLVFRGRVADASGENFVALLDIRGCGKIMEEENMKKVLRWLIPILVLTIISAVTVHAGTFRSPSKDTVCQAFVGGACANNFGISPQSGADPIIPGLCTPSQIGLVGWDLSDITDQIASAELVMTTYNVVGAIPGTPVELQLFNPSTHAWTEVGSSPGSSGATLATTSVLLANSQTPQTIVFGGSANLVDAATLGAHFESLRASGSATVGVRISGGCTPSTNVFINDRDDTGNLPGGAAATEPDLILFTPTAVSLASVGVASNSTGVATAALLLAAVLGLATAGVAYTSRSTHSRQD